MGCGVERIVRRTRFRLSRSGSNFEHWERAAWAASGEWKSEGKGL